ncbi:hypothetical protein CVD28_01985 [Bacillus sp. M6-12]|uniref:hypothetical protein n=1 Tax=Bacillus sp. M6-12 TaxID=2054166 RepID=UPI000C78662E|nr:hypothetical protein [Bacillus sp. M6-12]PLS19202.1 hypothetical protein CVD28_01985 [Bacillus sp. M6-12]
MKKTIMLIGTISIVSTLLFGCAEAKEPIKEDTHSSNEEINYPKEVVLHTEDEIVSDGYVDYVFNGFIGEDTLSFEQSQYDKTYSSFHPAKIGYTFRLKEIESIQFEVIDFSRDQGFVKLKVIVMK